MLKIEDRRDQFMANWDKRVESLNAFIDDFQPDKEMYTCVEIPTTERHALNPYKVGQIIKIVFRDLWSCYCRVICFRVLAVNNPWELLLELCADSEHVVQRDGCTIQSEEFIKDKPVTLTLNPDLIFAEEIYADELKDLRRCYGERFAQKGELLMKALQWFYRDDAAAQAH